MITIYCIEDINGLKYIGSTKQDINKRFSAHKRDAKRYHYVSSSKLDLEHSVIYEIERCPENERIKRESYWINEIDCVNEIKHNFNEEEYNREYQRIYRQINKDKSKEYQSEYRMTRKLTYDFLKMLDEY